MNIERKMPPKFYLGEQASGIIGAVINNRKDSFFLNVNKRPTVMGFILPEWQRGRVWSQAQSISLIESIWRGIPIGTYTYNQCEDSNSPYDGLLIDGQQRMFAIQDYIDDKFKVMGYFFSELTTYDVRDFKIRHFASYIYKSENEEDLKSYYNLMNFGGVAHKDGEQA